MINGRGDPGDRAGLDADGDVLHALAGFVGQHIELASDAPTPAQMAAALSQALGRRSGTRVPLGRRQQPLPYLALLPQFP